METNINEDKDLGVIFDTSIGSQQYKVDSNNGKRRFMQRWGKQNKAFTFIMFMDADMFTIIYKPLSS